ncbi:MAG: GFA family protein [Planktomarina sp.]
MAQPLVLRGQCLCGVSTFTLTGPHNWVGHCHCDSCRKATGSAFVTWIGQPNGAWAFTGQAPSTFQSSEKVTRGFCGTCGTPLFYKSIAYPDETHFYAALIDNPDNVTPTEVYFTAEKVSWIVIPDHLQPAELKT